VEVPVLIQAAGKTWIVEQEDLDRSLWAGGGRFSGVTFRNLDYSADELYVRWVLRPDRLTPGLAHELFEIAGARTWRDPRDSRCYEIQLDANASLPTPSGEGPTSLEVIRFSSAEGEAEAPWTLDKPLGWATDSELMSLVDRAFQSRPPRGVPTD
jgi:hypothetical protein